MNQRLNDLEFRMLDNRNPEIVQWKTDSGGKDYCFTILWYKKDSEGYHVEFVGDRPFQYHDTESLWKLMVYGNKIMEAIYNLEGN